MTIIIGFICLFVHFFFFHFWCEKYRYQINLYLHWWLSIWMLQVLKSRYLNQHLIILAWVSHHSPNVKKCINSVIKDKQTKPNQIKGSNWYIDVHTQQRVDLLSFAQGQKANVSHKLIAKALIFFFRSQFTWMSKRCWRSEAKNIWNLNISCEKLILLIGHKQFNINTIKMKIETQQQKQN